MSIKIYSNKKRRRNIANKDIPFYYFDIWSATLKAGWQLELNITKLNLWLRYLKKKKPLGLKQVFVNLGESTVVFAVRHLTGFQN